MTRAELAPDRGPPRRRPDRGRTAPGRGAWCCSAACFEQAVGRGALARALRRAISSAELDALRATLIWRI